MKHHEYYVYIATNPTKTVLYTGVTNDVLNRMVQHREDAFGNKKTFAGKFHCYNLVYYEYFQYIKEAIGREKYIKGLKRQKKEALINYFNPEWRFLNSEGEITKGNLPIWTTEMEELKPY